MKLKQPISVTKIAELVGAEVIGDKNALVTGINEIHKVVKGDLTFVDVQKYFKKSLSSAATFVILNERIKCPEGKVLLFHEDPFTAYNTLTQHFQKFEYINTSIASTATIGEGTRLEPNVIIGEHVTVGKNCHIRANAVIHAHTHIGDNVIIHSGTVVGTDAFYYKQRPDQYEKWHSCGRVIIEDNVEIGALTTIDKGVSGDTIIGEGTKIDNHCHIGHGVVLGKRCLLAAQVGIAGKTIIEDEVILLGQVGVSKGLRIGKKASISAQSGVSKSLEGGKHYFGSPAVPIRKHHREKALVRKLPDIMERLERLEKLEKLLEIKSVQFENSMNGNGKH